MRPQCMRLALETFPHAQVRREVIAFPPCQRGPAEAKQRRTIAFEVSPECLVQKLLRLIAADMRMPPVELKLAVNVGEIHVQQSVLALHLFVERRARQRSVEHELMEVRLMFHGVFNLVFDVLRRMVFHPNNRRTQHANTVLA